MNKKCKNAEILSIISLIISNIRKEQFDEFVFFKSVLCQQFQKSQLRFYVLFRAASRVEPD
jgi:hypothetical protein